MRLSLTITAISAAAGLSAPVSRETQEQRMAYGADLNDRTLPGPLYPGHGLPVPPSLLALRQDAFGKRDVDTGKGAAEVSTEVSENKVGDIQVKKVGSRRADDTRSSGHCAVVCETGYVDADCRCTSRYTS